MYFVGRYELQGGRQEHEGDTSRGCHWVPKLQAHHLELMGS
jgi:hypothetical protein